MNSQPNKTVRRGDTVAIDGAYQYEAITRGNTIQRYWHRLKLRYIERFCLPESNDTVLDIGCGSGVVSDYLAKHAEHVVGIDANADAIAFATTKFTAANLEFIHGVVEDITLEPQSVDKIFCMELIEHIYENQAEQLLQNCFRFLRPSGRVLITTPNYHGLWPIVEFTMDKLRLAPQMMEEQHVTRYNRSRLRRLIERTGFQVRTLRTFSTLAPFCAPIPRLADWLDSVERRFDLPFGNVLLAVAVKTP